MAFNLGHLGIWDGMGVSSKIEMGANSRVPLNPLFPAWVGDDRPSGRVSPGAGSAGTFEQMAPI